MKSSGMFKLLVTVDVVLAAWLGWRIYSRAYAGSTATPAEAVQEGTQALAQAESGTESQAGRKSTKPGTNTPVTPFTAVYSADPKQFAENLRAIHCPDQTVRDIVTADVHRRFKAQEEALRPTPADHVPFTWSANTTEPRLLERRVQAALLARQEASLLRETLGCEETVAMPIYAMTTSDQRFEEQLAASPGLDSCSVRQVQDTYWIDVQALLQRTKGFWLPEDVAELQTLKEKRRQALGAFFPSR